MSGYSNRLTLWCMVLQGNTVSFPSTERQPLGQAHKLDNHRHQAYNTVKRCGFFPQYYNILEPAILKWEENSESELIKLSHWVIVKVNPGIIIKLHLTHIVPSLLYAYTYTQTHKSQGYITYYARLYCIILYMCSFQSNTLLSL